MWDAGEEHLGMVQDFLRDIQWRNPKWGMGRITVGWGGNECVKIKGKGIKWAACV